MINTFTEKKLQYGDNFGNYSDHKNDLTTVILSFVTGLLCYRCTAVTVTKV